jgi:hypothetical protein
LAKWFKRRAKFGLEQDEPMFNFPIWEQLKLLFGSAGAILLMKKILGGKMHMAHRY